MIRQFSFNHNPGIPKVTFSGFLKPAKLNLGDSGLHFWLSRSIYQITWGNQINKGIFIMDNLGNYQTSLNTEVKKRILWNNFNFHLFKHTKWSFFFKTNPKTVKFKIKHSECYTTKVAQLLSRALDKPIIFTPLKLLKHWHSTVTHIWQGATEGSPCTEVQCN